ncbi:MAG: glycerophosphodiester phosphodiesterase [Gammaproteobacteria bacterium]|jgi:glycerophosphoryl diester phosphodiesterase|nr:glycerophosphodiester phosphodiesterase [SAR86 cluster bacterium]MBT3439739.1 glycerophosphodiester phosphodiesterase [Gammaproteobacteria bacterium]MBT4245292.1 glycerophosphodiester phosphodiesterase [Gammaproteobacteria bacterium]MBT4586685.1 glycerophosphodiester phosphodiesterase [Gammaproteobacteria bacterium]MBT5408271.1 glycerophosphodiester phosphodiesterase [Gammaproteobacteria bacterium]
MIIAHRGISFDLPENSLPAFNASWDKGVDGIEGDFHLTKDGAIVCIHDDDTQRVCNQKLIVKDSTLEELKQLNLSHKISKNSKVKIPTLAEVLNVLPFGKKIFIEIKCGIEIIKPLIKELSQSEIYAEQAVIISFDERVIKTFKSAAPNYKAYWLYSYEPDCDFNKILDVMNDIKADGFSSDNEDSKFLIDKIIDAGFEYHSWTIDDLDIANKLIGWRVQSITTNNPDQIQ